MRHITACSLYLADARASARTATEAGECVAADERAAAANTGGGGGTCLRTRWRADVGADHRHEPADDLSGSAGLAGEAKEAERADPPPGRRAQEAARSVSGAG